MAKRILFVVNHAGYFLTHRLPLAVAARDAGYDVHIATPRSKHVPLIEEKGFAWHPLSLTRSGVNPLRELRAAREIERLYRDVRPDLVHQVTSKPMLYGTFAARRAGVPAVVNAVTGLGHLFIADDLYHSLLRGILAVGYRIALRHPRMRVVFQNDDDRGVFVRRRLIDPSQAVLIRGSGVDTKLFTPREGPRHDPPVVMFPSRMLVTKGIAEFISAVRILKNENVRARFVLVGEPDPDNPASVPPEVLDGWIRETGAEAWGRRTDMASVYREADIVCLPSYREGMPKVLLEAAATGLPSVTTDVPGCRDVVRDGDNGFLVPLRDGGVRIAEALRTLIADPALCARMGARGRQRAVEEFSLDRVIRDVLSLYSELTA
jgi:glycosyltransferase involved in cell wall biosynthesis